MNNSIKQREAAALKTYALYWDSYQQGDVETFASTLDDTFELIGTSEKEVCHTKADGIEFLRAQIGEIVGKVEMRNRQIKTTWLDPMMLINETNDIYVLTGEDWNFYATIRISTLLKETGEGWKVVHQHGSFPDMRVGEGETLAIEKISKENIELRDAVKRRTAELEAKNRDLEIETALERTRSQSMLMQHSDELLNISKVFHEQLLLLGIDSEFSFVWLPNEENRDHLFWATWMEERDGNKKFHARAITYPLDMTEPYTAACFADWRSGVSVHEHFVSPENIDTFFASWAELLEGAIKLKPAFFPAGIYYTEAFMKYGCFGIDIRRPLGPQEKEILHRFAIEFERSYTRFLDLKKAEAQAREAQIEAALERVRAQAMAMQHSNELQKVIESVYDRLVELGIEIHACTIITPSEHPEELLFWFASSAGQYNKPFHMPNNGMLIIREFFNGFKNKREIFSKTYSFQEKNKFFNYIFKHTDFKNIPENRKQLTLESKAYSICNTFMGYSGIQLNRYSDNPFSKQETEILVRFGKVFEQAYTRFLDLKKAEAQAREAQIEAALERVRAQTMAMHSSEDVGKCVVKMFSELTALGVDEGTRFGIGILNHDNENNQLWTARKNGDEVNMHIGTIDMASHPLLKSARNAWKEQVPFHKYVLEGEDLLAYYQMLNNAPDYKIQIPIEKLPKKEVQHCFIFEHGFFYAFSPREFQPELIHIIKRFSSLFEQTYTRFLDLQKAETQAREAQIEAALERVRTRSMAMHRSSELRAVVDSLYGELKSLQINFDNALIQLIKDDTKDLHLWISTADGLYNDMIHWPASDLPHFDIMYKARVAQSDVEVSLTPDQINAFFSEYFSLPYVPQERRAAVAHVRFFSIFGTYQKNTCVFLMKYSPGAFSAYEKDIITRFAKVFEQTYTRFLDLQKAEAQAREAQIEAALERIRSGAMAMQTSEELKDVAQELRKQMGLLGQKELEVCAIHLYEEHKDYFESWAAMHVPDEEGRLIQTRALFPKAGMLIIDEMMEFYASEKNEYVLVNEGIKAAQWFELLKEKTPDAFESIMKATSNIPTENMKAYWAMADFSGGALVMVTYAYPDEDSRDLLRRTANVFGLAYKRFKDLKIAEASALAARQQASLDRVRADISSMRHAEDLNRITPLIFNELTTLGIPFIRCGVFIVHETRKMVDVYLSNPEGKSLAAMKLAFDANTLTVRSVEAWERGEVYIHHWDKEDFINYGKLMVSEGQVKDMNTYQGNKEVPEALHLHFIPFTQGLLYVGATETLDDDKIDMIKALAKVFAIAYARYEDFVKLEQAKAEVESAIRELKATQSQLVQQEKLASLGQLTAGIAHEIKNPLNFVNNFSEVSLELIDEALDEIQKMQGNGHAAGTVDILSDIRSNLNKIHEHGSRANGIVNSMLQHSRGGSGKMEPTDLNALIKEYVNLSFHGMRAGKNPLDVRMVFDLDAAVGNISLIEEDFSRVVINLTNNAFDAMRLKLRTAKEPYQPQFIVRTAGIGEHVKISFEDNGPGIPEEIKDKIMQPFFTTKKGTEGTGLGLSISHDIVKAHGGELKVETTEGEGSLFIIELPKNT